MLEILIIDDHYLVGEGTKTMLESSGEFSVHYVSTAKDALSLNKSFDLYIIDIHMPGMTGIELSKELLRNERTRKIILYTGYADQESLDLFTEVGISGIASKTASSLELIQLIHVILAEHTIVPLSLFENKNSKYVNGSVEKHGLTERELTILKAISEGLSNKEIANELFLSDRAVEYQLTKIYKKMKVKNRGEAISVAIQRNLLE